MTAELHLEQRLPGGGTRRDHLEQLARSGGARSPKLTLPPLDHDGEALRGLFAELSACRRNGFGGPEALLPSDILAWCRLSGRPIDPWQWTAIQLIDSSFLREIARQADERSQKGPKA